MVAETDKLDRIFDALSKSSPEAQRRIQTIREGIGKLHEIPAYKQLLEGLDPNDVYVGDGKNESHFQASLVNMGGTKILKVDIWGEERGRASIVVDFMLAMRRPADARADVHDKDLLESDDQLLWKM